MAVKYVLYLVLTELQVANYNEPHNVVHPTLC
jgi:hypothetical protein